MNKKLEADLATAFQSSADIRTPKWLTNAGRAVQGFYSTMRLWERLSSQIEELNFPHQLKRIFPVLKHHAPNFPSVVGFCEVRPEMLTMLKSALIGMTYGFMEENQDDRSVFRYHPALDTAFDLLRIPESKRCRRPEHVTEDGQVEKALASTIQKIFKIVLDEMKSEGRNDHVDYMIYACAHFANLDAPYSRAGKKAISQAFKEYYASMPPDERSRVTSSNFFTTNQSTQFLINRLVTEARSEISQQSTLTLRDKKLG